jgi:hypothetical protein
MMNRNDWRFLLSTLMFVGWLTACSTTSELNLDTTPLPEGAVPPLQSGQVRQWATGAGATSEYADPEWAASQATGEPDTPRCGDYQTAWATAGSDTVETLVLTYTLSVNVTGINVVQSFNPNQVTQVDLIGDFGRPITVYEGEPFQVDQPCPYTLAIPIEKTNRAYNKVQITVNQSVLGLGWNQIDAVELIGDRE